MSGTTTTIAPVRIRLSPVRRIELAQRLTSLIGAAVWLGHPESQKLIPLQTHHFYYSRTDAALLRGIAVLTRFVQSRAEDGIELPHWHDCRVESPLPRELVTVLGQAGREGGE